MRQGLRWFQNRGGPLAHAAGAGRFMCVFLLRLVQYSTASPDPTTGKCVIRRAGPSVDKAQTCACDAQARAHARTQSPGYSNGPHYRTGPDNAFQENGHTPPPPVVQKEETCPLSRPLQPRNEASWPPGAFT